MEPTLKQYSEIDTWEKTEMGVWADSYDPTNQDNEKQKKKKNPKTKNQNYPQEFHLFSKVQLNLGLHLLDHNNKNTSLF